MKIFSPNPNHTAKFYGVGMILVGTISSFFIVMFILMIACCGLDLIGLMGSK